MASKERLIALIFSVLYPVKSYEMASVLLELGVTPDDKLDPFTSKKIYVRAALIPLPQRDLEALAERVVERLAGAEGFEANVDALRQELAVMPSHTAKHIIFANTAKLEIGHTDLIDGDIEIISGAEHCLVYDRPIDEGGLTWEHLIHWYADRLGIEPLFDDAPEQLGERLTSVLGSPPEKHLFEAYWKLSARDFRWELPALLPQVQLLHDPKTKWQRGGVPRYKHQRMDFALILPRGVRAILEVDGKQHYADDAGRASPKLYAEMVAADREMKLRGYEIYRFGGHELYDAHEAEIVVKTFFTDLLAKHGVPVPF